MPRSLCCPKDINSFVFQIKTFGFSIFLLLCFAPIVKENKENTYMPRGCKLWHAPCSLLLLLLRLICRLLTSVLFYFIFSFYFNFFFLFGVSSRETSGKWKVLRMLFSAFLQVWSLAVRNNFQVYLKNWQRANKFKVKFRMCSWDVVGLRSSQTESDFHKYLSRAETRWVIYLYAVCAA